MTGTQQSVFSLTSAQYWQLPNLDLTPSNKYVVLLEQPEEALATQGKVVKSDITNKEFKNAQNLESFYKMERSALELTPSLKQAVQSGIVQAYKSVFAAEQCLDDAQFTFNAYVLCQSPEDVSEDAVTDMFVLELAYEDKHVAAFVFPQFTYDADLTTLKLLPSDELPVQASPGALQSKAADVGDVFNGITSLLSYLPNVGPIASLSQDLFSLTQLLFSEQPASEIDRLYNRLVSFIEDTFKHETIIEQKNNVTTFINGLKSHMAIIDRNKNDIPTVVREIENNIFPFLDRALSTNSGSLKNSLSQIESVWNRTPWGKGALLKQTLEALTACVSTNLLAYRTRVLLEAQRVAYYRSINNTAAADEALRDYRIALSAYEIHVLDPTPTKPQALESKLRAYINRRNEPGTVATVVHADSFNFYGNPGGRYFRWEQSGFVVGNINKLHDDFEDGREAYSLTTGLVSSEKISGWMRDGFNAYMRSQAPATQVVIDLKKQPPEWLKGFHDLHSKAQNEL
ncbi:hypothetical protein [Pseudoalteromonas rubra]|uniref:hypothetical protein n=1 Tax=Pseudoalteromonas rubra TaxID=43658 RepID=UPI002DBB5879|nr:hypothetical protein [Pseudoalteromonas rubra]MEC4088050.1 hypothetical protein [Pseudoalteromonas rubra]